MRKGPRPIPLIDRLMRSVVDQDGCWIWTGVVSRNGYGRIGAGGKYGKQVSTHRASYEYFVDDIPAGLTIDHLCRHRLCVNPDHLQAVPMRENLLRGLTITAQKAAQTHCVHGHEFTPENTARKPNGTRRCRECSRIGARRRKRKKAAA